MPGRGNSSRSSAIEPSSSSTGTRLRSKRPSLIASSARRCDSAAYSSSAVREMPSMLAIASAATPWFVWGWRARRWRLPLSMKGERLMPAVLALYDDIISAPPEITTSSRPGGDRRGGEVGGGDARAAEAVEGDAAGRDVEAGVERGHAPEVAALGADLHARAEDDVVDVRGVEVVALGDGAEDRGPEPLRVVLGEGSLAHLPDAPRRAAAVDDPGFAHLVRSSSLEVPSHSVYSLRSRACTSG